MGVVIYPYPNLSYTILLIGAPVFYALTWNK